ncbi:thioredoxin family protein [Mesobacillus zeae]|uniref:Thioredoxin family protein n=1 Tax=Mesobacillus zeae TaxID=1917180 RepID=A0A398B3X1_9BACI|nr:thioredoxin family protein [Mesobacillus zeae]RID82476.1 thioredoxin family protein [Mesobacillus zeae]
MKIKVLGTGCKKCKELEQNVLAAVNEMGIEAEVEKVEDIRDIMSYKIMSTPALVVEEKVVSTGKLLSVGQVKELISK